MPVAVVTGAGGLIGSEASRYFIEQGFDVVGIENNLRMHFFGKDGSTQAVTESLKELDGFRNTHVDIRDEESLEWIFRTAKPELVIHCAAQPSHDWAASDPRMDFDVNAVGTLTLLEASRRHCPDAPFVFCSTSKVYGDRPNKLPLSQIGSRLELPRQHRLWEGISTEMSIDRSLHSLFGVSKTAADLLVQEYGRYFEMPTVAFRGGCLTGPQHAGAELHGFLAYLMKCVVEGRPYRVLGYGGLQVRDNIHSADLVRAFDAFRKKPRAGAVYNIGGGRPNSCSVLEAIRACEAIAGKELDWRMGSRARIGDHRWWITDLREFRRDYPEWEIEIDLEETLQQIHDQLLEQVA